MDWWIEKQPHVSQIQIFVRRAVEQFQFSVTKNAIHLKLSATQPSNINDQSHSSQSNEVTIKFDCEVDPSPSSFSLYRGKQWCRLTVKIVNGCGIESDDSEEFPPSNELNARHLRQVYCRCGRSLLNEPPSRCLPLPSAYWNELVDLWYCHTEHNDKLDRLSGLTVMAKPGLALIGTHDVRFVRSDIDPAAVSVDTQSMKLDQTEKSKKSSSTSISEPRCVRCVACQTTIGLAVIITSALPVAKQSITNDDESQSNIIQQDEIHLFKHYISNIEPTASHARDIPAESGLIESLAALEMTGQAMNDETANNEDKVPSLYMPYYSMETYFSSLLLARCDARCCYRFRIQPSQSLIDNTEPSAINQCISLTLLNIDTCLRSITTPANVTRREQGFMCPVLKCAFQLISAEGEQDTAKKHFDVIHCTNHEFKSLQEILQSHHTDVPDEFSHFGKMKLTYLKKLTRNK